MTTSAVILKLCRNNESTHSITAESQVNVLRAAANRKESKQTHSVNVLVTSKFKILQLKRAFVVFC